MPQIQANVDNSKLTDKIGQAHLTAFAERFPSQLEHEMRLISERLITGLAKTEATVLTDTTTWSLSPEEIYYLAQALNQLHSIRARLNVR
jgi:hypothetical protein